MAPSDGAARYLLAMALEAAGGQREAAELLSQLSSSSGPNGDELVWRGRARLEAVRGDWKAACDAWEQLSRLAQERGDAGWSLAYLKRAAELCDARAGDKARAETLYVRLAAADPGDTAVARGLARLRAQRGAFLEAAQALGDRRARPGRRRAAAGDRRGAGVRGPGRLEQDRILVDRAVARDRQRHRRSQRAGSPGARPSPCRRVGAAGRGLSQAGRDGGAAPRCHLSRRRWRAVARSRRRRLGGGGLLRRGRRQGAG